MEMYGDTNTLLNPSYEWANRDRYGKLRPVLGYVAGFPAWTVKTAYAVCEIQLRKHAVSKTRFAYVDDQPHALPAFDQYTNRACTVIQKIQDAPISSSDVDLMMSIHDIVPKIDISITDDLIRPFMRRILRSLWTQVILRSPEVQRIVQDMDENTLALCFCDPPNADLGMHFIPDDLKLPLASENLEKGGLNRMGEAFTKARNLYIKDETITTVLVMDCGQHNYTCTIPPHLNPFNEFVLLINASCAFPSLIYMLAKALTNDHVKRIILMCGTRAKLREPGQQKPFPMADTFEDLGSFIHCTNVDYFYLTNVPEVCYGKTPLKTYVWGLQLCIVHITSIRLEFSD